MSKPGVKINPLPVWFLAGSSGNSVVNHEGPAELSEILLEAGLSREEWLGESGELQSHADPRFSGRPLLSSCVN